MCGTYLMMYSNSIRSNGVPPLPVVIFVLNSLGRMVLETATIIFEPMARGESKKMQVTNQNSNHRRELGRTLSRNLRTLESSVRANRNRTNSMGERLGLLDGVGVAVSNRPVMFTLRTSNDQILYQWNVAPIQYIHVLQCLECSRARRYCMLMYINMYRCT